MKSRLVAVVAALALLVPGSVAQNQGEGAALRWGVDLEQAIEQAKKSNRPLMLWVIRSSDRKENSGENMERDQKRAFSDARVVELSKRFVLSKISASRYRDQLSKWHVREGASFDVLFVNPAGDLISDLDPSGATKPDTLALKMSEAFRAWRDKLYAEKLKPAIEGEKGSPKDQKAALETIEDLTILSADSALITLIEKEGVDESVQSKAIDVLGKLSTKPGAVALLKRAAADTRAEKALHACQPNVAEELLEGIGGEDSAKHWLCYSALCKICKIQNAKPEKFWSGKNQKIKDDEIKRVKELATKAAVKWRERNEEYR